jgi:23S rRNA pseudouridine1911/1915/1917 synthase
MPSADRDHVYAGVADRLDRAVATTAAVSRTAARALIAAGAVFLNGRRCKVASRTVHPGDRLRVGAPPAAVASTPLPILFEGDGLLAIDKPPGMPSAPTREGAAGTAFTVLQAQRGGRPLWLVHRLDAAASGVLLFATTRAAAAALSAAFHDQQVEKTYLALVDGAPAASAGVIDQPLVAARGYARVDRRGKPSRTAWRVEERRGATTLLVVTPSSGRLHQIRAHLAAIGHPIVGDRRYGGSAAPRLMLHARALGLRLGGRRVEISAPWTPA